jgi:polar amino acid transport system substrate-binding protein
MRTYCTKGAWLIISLLGSIQPQLLRAADSLRTIEVGLIEFSPLVTQGSEISPEGPLFDYAHQILLSAGVSPQYREVSINRSLEQLRNQRLDIVLTLFKSKEREAFVRFSKEPLLWVTNGFCTKEDVRKKPLTAASRLAHVRGTLIPTVLSSLEPIPVNTEKAQVRMLQMLMRNRVDAIYSPKPQVIMLAAQIAQITTPLYCYELKADPVAIYFGFSKKMDDGLVQRIENALHKALHQEDFDNYLKKRLSGSIFRVDELQTIDPSALPPAK